MPPKKQIEESDDDESEEDEESASGTETETNSPASSKPVKGPGAVGSNPPQKAVAKSPALQREVQGSQQESDDDESEEEEGTVRDTETEPSSPASGKQVKAARVAGDDQQRSATSKPEVPSGRQDFDDEELEKEGETARDTETEPDSPASAKQKKLAVAAGSKHQRTAVANVQESEYEESEYEESTVRGTETEPGSPASVKKTNVQFAAGAGKDAMETTSKQAGARKRGAGKGATASSASSTGNENGGSQQRLGFTPVPQGIGDIPMLFTGERYMNMAFRMLDINLRGSLDRDQARKWLRCLGWCVPLHSLDSMLNQGKPAERVQFWDLPTLTRIVKAHSKTQNIALVDLQAALRKLAGNRARIHPDRFRELVTADCNIQTDAMEDICALLGLTTSGTADCNSLAEDMLNKICQPPTPLEIQQRRT